MTKEEQAAISALVEAAERAQSAFEMLAVLSNPPDLFAERHALELEAAVCEVRRAARAATHGPA